MLGPRPGVSGLVSSTVCNTTTGGTGSGFLAPPRAFHVANVQDARRGPLSGCECTQSLQTRPRPLPLVSKRLSPPPPPRGWASGGLPFFALPRVTRMSSYRTTFPFPTPNLQTRPGGCRRHPCHHAKRVSNATDDGRRALHWVARGQKPSPPCSLHGPLPISQREPRQPCICSPSRQHSMRRPRSRSRPG